MSQYITRESTPLAIHSSDSLATYHRTQKCLCSSTSQEMNRLRHWPSAKSFTPASQMRPKNTLAIGHAKQEKLNPIQRHEKKTYIPPASVTSKLPVSCISLPIPKTSAGKYRDRKQAMCMK